MEKIELVQFLEKIIFICLENESTCNSGEAVTEIKEMCLKKLEEVSPIGELPQVEYERRRNFLK